MWGVSGDSVAFLWSLPVLFFFYWGGFACHPLCCFQSLLKVLPVLSQLLWVECRFLERTVSAGPSPAVVGDPCAEMWTLNLSALSLLSSPALMSLSLWSSPWYFWLWGFGCYGDIWASNNSNYIQWTTIMIICQNWVVDTHFTLGSSHSHSQQPVFMALPRPAFTAAQVTDRHNVWCKNLNTTNWFSADFLRCIPVDLKGLNLIHPTEGQL